jgi:hypothetical protein
MESIPDVDPARAAPVLGVPFRAAISGAVQEASGSRVVRCDQDEVAGCCPASR